jgi:hypothetical protein
MSEREVMLSGRPYKPWSKELQDDRDKARTLIERYNASMSSDKQLRSGLIAALFGKIDKEHPPHLTAPFYCDYVSLLFATQKTVTLQYCFLSCIQLSVASSGYQAFCA